MKKLYIYALALFCVTCVLSCDDKKEELDEVKEMNQDEQKNYLDQVAVDLTKKIPASDFKDLSEFMAGLADIYGDYSWSTVGDTMSSMLEKSSVLIDQYEYSDTVYSSFNESYIKYYVAVFDMSLTLSNFTGHYTADNGGWKYSEADDLQFLFKDKDGKDCSLTLSKSGKEVRLRMPSITRSMGHEYSYEEVYDETTRRNYYYDYLTYYKTKLNAIIFVPEKVSLSLKKSGKAVADVTIQPSLEDLVEDGYFDLGHSSLLSASELELNNGYKVSFEGKSTANRKLALSYTLSNKKGELLSFSISGDPTGVPSIIFNDDFQERDLKYEIQNGNSDIKNAYLSLSVNDKAKIIGKVNGVREFLSLEDSILRNWRDGEKYQYFTDQENRLLDLGLYYGNSDLKQASVEFEVVCETQRYWVGVYTDPVWVEEYYYHTIPVLVFNDGSRTSFEEFFNEDDFRNAIKAFEALDEDYQNLYGGAE